MKTCFKCKVEKPFADFNRSTIAKDGYNMYCRECCCTANALTTRFYRYGITKEDFDTRLALQDGGCAICGSTLLLSVDHSHETGFNRGILCRRCNLGLGYFDDDPDTMLQAIEYLKTAHWSDQSRRPARKFQLQQEASQLQRSTA